MQSMPASATKDSSSAGASRAAEPQQHKRRRISYACDHCRAKKNRCDGERPTCSPCKTRQLECVYAVQRPRPSVTQEYVDNLKAKNQMLEQQLAAINNGGRNGSISSYPDSIDNSAAPQQSGHHLHGDVRNGYAHASSVQRSFHAQTPSTTSSYSPTPLQHQPLPERPSPGHSGVDAHYAGNASTVSQAGRHVFRKPVDRGVNNESAETSEYYGESSTFDFMTKIASPGEDNSKADPRRTGPGSVDASLAMGSQSEPLFEGLVLGPGTDDPFGLPRRMVADKLVDSYFTYRHPLNAYMHEATFRKRYERLWLSEELGGEEASEANLAWIGLVNLVFTFGSQGGGRMVVDRARYFKRAKTLVFSGLLQASSIELVQGLLLMGRFYHGSLELNNCWTVVGLAIRMAQGLGLHLDASSFTSDLIEQEVRKRVWWGCFVLDRVLSMKVGRPPTIHDGPNIEVGYPLAVDDEYLTSDSSRPPIQPPSVPSKMEFLIHVIPQCRLLEQICELLYERTPTDSPKQQIAHIPKILAKAVELDGALMAWQQALPPHLKFDSQVEGWQVERQRNTLLMRFLNARLVLHRQLLLIYVTRRITDTFQLEIMYCCVQRCIMAAHDIISQMRALHQRTLLHSWWHNSHYVFAALGVMLAFKSLDEPSKHDVRLPKSLDVDEIIAHGNELLEEVGGQLHPIAARYLKSLRRMETKLKTVTASREKVLENLPPPPAPPPQEEVFAKVEYNINPWSNNMQMTDDFGQYQQVGDNSSMMFVEDFNEIESMFYNTGWFGQVEWSDAPQQ